MIVDLEPTDDQRLIEESVRGLLANELPVDRLREDKAWGGAAEKAVWDSLAELGLFGLGLSEEQGGFGFGLPGEVMVAKALGSHLVSPAVLAQLLAAHLTDDADLRAGLAAGTTKVAFANPVEDGIAHLIDADAAEYLILLSDGVKLLPRSAFDAGTPVDGMDEAVKLVRAKGDTKAVARDAVADRASLLLAAYQVGLAQGATHMAVEYAGTREQFGQVIGSFQALKHMMADMVTRASAGESQCYHAAATFGLGLDDRAEIAAARLIATDAALANAKSNVQIHGGMGFTAECDAHLFLKRAHLFAMLGTSAGAERRRVIGV